MAVGACITSGALFRAWLTQRLRRQKIDSQHHKKKGQQNLNLAKGELHRFKTSLLGILLKSVEKYEQKKPARRKIVILGFLIEDIDNKATVKWRTTHLRLRSRNLRIGNTYNLVIRQLWMLNSYNQEQPGLALPLTLLCEIGKTRRMYRPWFGHNHHRGCFPSSSGASNCGCQRSD